MTEAEEVRALWEASRKKEAEAKFIFRGSHRYREQDGCHNCARMYRLGQFDGEDELYCTCGAGRRPRSGAFTQDGKESHIPKNIHNPKCDDIILARSDRWDKWKIGRDVKPYSICNFYKRKVT